MFRIVPSLFVYANDDFYKYMFATFTPVLTPTFCNRTKQVCRTIKMSVNKDFLAAILVFARFAVHNP